VSEGSSGATAFTGMFDIGVADRGGRRVVDERADQVRPGRMPRVRDTCPWARPAAGEIERSGGAGAAGCGVLGETDLTLLRAGLPHQDMDRAVPAGPAGRAVNSEGRADLQDGRR
jgi:hypothetical protein